MVLDEFACDPDGTANSALFSLARGAFAFIAGKVAKTGSLVIDTPVACIRGRAQGGGIGILSLAALAFSVVRDVKAPPADSVPADVSFLDYDAITYKDLE